jgi:tetratricopeptide (TPR) repeat protein
MELTAEERLRIYEEEKARAEARARIESEQRTAYAKKHRKRIIVIGCIGTTLCLLAVATQWYASGRARKSKVDLEDEARISELTAAFGPNAELVEKALLDRASDYDTRKMFAEAEPFFRQVLKIDQAVAGESRPYTANAWSLLGSNLQEQKKYGEAEGCFKTVLLIRQGALEAWGDHPPFPTDAVRPSDIASALSDLASLYEDMKRYQEAESRLRQALEIFTKEKGGSSQEVAGVLIALSRTLKAQGRDTEGEAMMDKWSAIILQQKIHH